MIPIVYDILLVYSNSHTELAAPYCNRIIVFSESVL